MSDQLIKYMMIGAGGLFAIIVVAYMMLAKKMNKSEEKYLRSLQQGTKKSAFNSEIMYQKLYVFFLKTPFLKRYILKLRRRIEIINIDDEYLTRKQSAVILFRAVIITIILAIAIIAFTHSNILLMTILLIFLVFMVDTIIDGSVDKMDNKLLKQQIDFFAEIRHAYHEFNMVEEAIYQVSQDDEALEMARQGEKIYEVLISNDPEGELEKYYDIAPNAYLKEFAGVSYLTKEFGDRTVDGASLYLKNLNNITQEMQLEILKRDKLDYVFQSLSVIAILPMLFLEAIKNWAISQFSFVESFYAGKQGMLVQILVLVCTFVCYILTRTLKDNGSTKIAMQNENPWQAKLYKIPLVKKIVDLFMPKNGTKDHRKIKNILKNAASKQKIEWLYVNRITLALATFIVSFFMILQLHRVQIQWVYTEPTSDYNIIGEMSDKDKKTAMEVTKQDNVFLDYFKGKLGTKQADIEKEMRKSKYSEYFKDSTDEEITTAAKRVFEKLQKINTEQLKPYEVLLSMVFAILGYNAPILLLKFQVKMRQMEMENEVMQFQTIILMLMKIERVNVEIILEWLERYSNIFREPINKCVNNYEAGPWEALEQMKEDVNYKDFLRIIESLQAAVEKIPIEEAFDELDTERDYYQAKRQESNDRLISKKGMIGKFIGFAPMVLLFVGYLIVPLVFIGLTSMSSSFSSMQA